MEFLPISLNVEGKKIVIIGGGKVALHKVQLLQRFKTTITVVAKEPLPEIINAGVNVIEKAFEPTDLSDSFLVYACTNNRELNAQISALCHNQNILVNVADDPELCDFVSPAIHKNGQYSVAVGSNATNVKQSIIIRDFLSGVLMSFPGLFRNKNRKTKPQNSSDKQTPKELTQECKIVLVGFGPGNPELLTVKALYYLSQADIIFHDALLDSQFLKSFKAEKVCVGKRCGNHSKTQQEINELLLEAAQSNQKIVRLKGGDPMVFGRAGEEISFLEQHHIEVEVVPGVSSALAAAAQFKLPLTQRTISSSIAFCHGHHFAQNSFPNADTLAFYMGAAHQQEIAQKLIAEGRPGKTPVALISNASYDYAQSRFTTLKELAGKAQLNETPLLILVGESIRNLC